MPPDDGRVAIVHGDYRIDNMIFDAKSPRLLAVLDWELSTLGHPFADLAYQCMQWRLPNANDFRGLGGLDRKALGLPDGSRLRRRLLPADRAGLSAALDLPDRVQLFPDRGDRSGRLQARARRQRLQSRAGAHNGRGGADDVATGAGDDRGGVSISPCSFGRRRHRRRRAGRDPLRPAARKCRCPESTCRYSSRP